MALRKTVKSNKYLAKLADKNAHCAFCNRKVDDETVYGKLYTIGDIHCHYFCVLLSCCLIQKGKDEEGLFGFMYPDILAEIERSKKHRCSYCSTEGATLGCSITQCKKQFHLPCGREKNAVALFYGNYKSFCEKHAPKQKIPDVIMSKAKMRLARMRKIKKEKTLKNLKGFKGTGNATECPEEPECVCVICYEMVDGFPTTETFWPPCCARDAWFHRTCLQRMALSAGCHYLKCPLCNDKETFSTAALSQGYYIPDRDAAWELEQNAFSEIYERPVVCRAEECKCPRGREYDADSGMWDIKLCVLCGSPGTHSACCTAEYYVCAVCGPAAPDQTHLAAIDAVSLPSQQNHAGQRVQSGPIMPSRMSLRRTKPRHSLYTSSSSSQNFTKKTENDKNVKTNTDISRDDLNLKTPKRPVILKPTDQIIHENEMMSPLKLLKQGLNEKISSVEVENIISDNKVLNEMKEKFRKPKPLSVKRKIVDHILEGLLVYVTNERMATEEDSVQRWDSEILAVSIEKTPLIANKLSDSDIQEISDYHTNSLSDNYEELLQDVTKTPEKLDICENANMTSKSEIETDDNSSNSTFQLPPEFIAESSNSFPIIDTPKNLKKINIENDTMEISENNQIVNIDLVKVENSESITDFKILDKNRAFKFSPLNKDILEKNLDIDVESFKNQYLNEVDRKLHCKVDNTDNVQCTKDLAVDTPKRPKKRKLPSEDSVASKRRKTTKMVRKNEQPDSNRTDSSKCKVKRRRKNHDTELSIRNKNIKLKIRFKVQDLKVKFTKSKKRSRKIKNGSPKVLKQYILQYPLTQTSPKDTIARPDTDVVALKKKRMKSEKSSDNLKQTSIDSFFKTSPKT